MEEAFEQCAMAMFGYMTDLERVQMTQLHRIETEGHDMESLLFHFLDELLFMFSAEPFIVAKVYYIPRTLITSALDLKFPVNYENALLNISSTFFLSFTWCHLIDESFHFIYLTNNLKIKYKSK